MSSHCPLTLQVHDDTLVIFTDSDDVLLMPGCTPDMLRDKFSRRHSKAPILFSAERDNWWAQGGWGALWSQRIRDEGPGVN